MRKMLRKLGHHRANTPVPRPHAAPLETCRETSSSLSGHVSHPCVLPADGHTMHACAFRDCTWGY